VKLGNILPTFQSTIHLARMRLNEQSARATGLVATLAVAVVTWVVLSAVASPLLAFKVGDVIDATVAVTNARVSGSVFPLRYAQRIERMSDVKGVIYLTVATFPCADGRTTVAINAYGGSEVTRMLRSDHVSDAMITAWNKTPNGILLGSDIAHQCGLAPGMTLSPRSRTADREIPITIVGILPANTDGPPIANKIAIGHYDYINPLLPERSRDQVRIMVVIGKDPTRLPQLAAAIEREFAADDPPLEASVSSGTTTILGRFGQVQSLLALVMAAMAACALLVFVTVLAHQIAQRRAGMAILQTIGFGRGVQFGALVLELLLIAGVGTTVGIIAGRAVMVLINPLLFRLTGLLRTPDWALWGLFPAVFLLLALSLIWPALQISKLKPIDHLRI